MKKLLYLLLTILPGLAFSQGTITHRIIYIGDAGETDTQQGGVISHAQDKILQGKTTVIYLGDNIYPTGIGLPGSKEEDHTKEILQSQFKPMRAKGAPVYFIPGNHDWDRMGPLGLAKMKRQWEYIDEQKDSLLKVVPKNGCPDPYEIKINDDFVVIAFDSEWWLYVYSKENPDADCDCKTEDEIIRRFRELLLKNHDKVIMLADHHPFWSYGHHGGYYNIADYFFPLTSVQKNLYIPFPGIGALYPLVRGTFSLAEDQAHPLYKTMISKIDNVFKEFPNLIHVSGHEHGLQFIKDGEQIQVVSGSGAKEAFVKKGKHALYAETTPGFVTADLMADKSIRFTYYAGKDTSFKQVYAYTKPYRSVKPVTIPTSKPVTQDSILIKANPNFDKVSGFHRKLFGENYRKEWAAAVKLPVIKISSFKGGLTPVKYGGAHQTLALRLIDKEGKEWLLRSIEKYPEIKLPQARRETFATSWKWDAISAQHPYASLVAPVLAKAVKVSHTNPIVGWVSPDRALGIYENDFAKTICILEPSLGEGRSDNTGIMMKSLDRDNSNRIDTLEFLRARLLDWFIGDWDQQQDQWHWKNRTNGKNKYYSAVPRDRDQAFFVNEGLIPRMAAVKWRSPFLKGYQSDQRDINDFYFNGRELDVRFLSGISYNTWKQTAKTFAAALTDDVLNDALNHMPTAANNIRHQELLKLMQRRRATMVSDADRFYRFFNRIVDVKATDVNELLVVKDTAGNNINVSVYKRLDDGSISYPLFSKVFDHNITKEIRIYAGKGQDSIIINDRNTLIKVRVIGGQGQKSLNIVSANNHTKYYGKESKATFIGTDSVKISKHFSNDTTTVAYVPVNQYFNSTIPDVSMGFNPDDGYWINAGVIFTSQGFRKAPGSIQQFNLLHSFGNGANKFNYVGQWFNAVKHSADIEVQARFDFPNTINFFGKGNETDFDKNGHFKTYYRAKFDLAEVTGSLRFHNSTGSVNLRIGPTFQYYRFNSDDNDRLIYHPNLFNNYDSLTYTKNKLYAGLTMTYIDDKRNSPLMASYGVYISLKFQQLFGLNSYSNTFFQFTPQAELYKSVTANSSIVISYKLGGGITFGQPAFYQSVFLGGPESLPGLRQYRYAGQQAFYNVLQGRFKLSNFTSYILPGQIGLTALYGIGRVWDKNQPSKVWHNSVGGGIYFMPADMMLLNLQGAYSADGFYPYITLKLNL
ncbi:metallophosphoesterase [Mucilaginibacter sp. KACC 22063]|uniref:metallophosphoesterase n=1 Tax=Mucilaginibacter sp. KACC 22063 TaxID=3025666 RepID=UPI0023656167|nr:metallophosphoesterase [Mucilaginibacter sp. KACC 22063]WDF56198.1 metallophosphoesterase [Mucilaginibacter sp. KACC 22063]